MAKLGLDATDIRILSTVQAYGQLSKSRLAELVNLSPTPCWARLARLKAEGFIRSYHADVALNRIFDFTQVIVTISLTHHRKIDFERFESHIMKCDEVIDCIATGGGTDYVLKVITPSLGSFQAFMDDLLIGESNIDRYMTYIVTRRVKHTQPNIIKLMADAGVKPDKA